MRVRGSGPGGALNEQERSRFRLALLSRSADWVGGGRAAVADAEPDAAAAELHRERDAEAQRIAAERPPVGPPAPAARASFLLPDGTVLDPSDPSYHRYHWAVVGLRVSMSRGFDPDAPPPAQSAPSSVPSQSARERGRAGRLSHSDIARRRAAAQRRLKRQARNFDAAQQGTAHPQESVGVRAGRVGAAAVVGAGAFAPGTAVITPTDSAAGQSDGQTAQVRSVDDVFPSGSARFENQRVRVQEDRAEDRAEAGRSETAQPAASQSESSQAESSQAAASQSEAQQQADQQAAAEQQQQQAAEQQAQQKAGDETEQPGAETEQPAAEQPAAEDEQTQQEKQAEGVATGTEPGGTPPKPDRRDPQRGDGPPGPDSDDPGRAPEPEPRDARRTRGIPAVARWRGRTRYRANLVSGRVTAQPVDDTNLRSFEVVRRGPRNRFSLRPRRPYVAGILQVSGDARPTALSGRNLRAQPVAGRAPTAEERELIQREGPPVEVTWEGHSEYTLNLHNRRVTARAVDDTNLRTFEVTRRGNRFVPLSQTTRGAHHVGNLRISPAGEPTIVPQRVAVAARPGLAGLFRRTGGERVSAADSGDGADSGDETERAAGGPGARARRVATGLRETPGRFRSRIEELNVPENSLEAQARRGLSRFRTRATSLNPERPITIDQGAETSAGAAPQENGMQSANPAGNGSNSRGAVSRIRERFRARRDPGARVVTAPSDQSVSDGSDRLAPDRYRPPRSDNPGDNIASGAAQTFGAAASPMVAFGDAIFGGPQTRPQDERSPAESLPGGSDFQVENNERGLGGDAEPISRQRYRNTGYGEGSPVSEGSGVNGAQENERPRTRQQLQEDIRERYRRRRMAGAAGGSLSGDQTVSDGRTNAAVDAFPRFSIRKPGRRPPAGFGPGPRRRERVCWERVRRPLRHGHNGRTLSLRPSPRRGRDGQPGRGRQCGPGAEGSSLHRRLRGRPHRRDPGRARDGATRFHGRRRRRGRSHRGRLRHHHQ